MTLNILFPVLFCRLDLTLIKQMSLTPSGGEAAEQHEGRGDQSSERQNDQDGEHHTCSGALTPPALSAHPRSV